MNIARKNLFLEIFAASRGGQLSRKDLEKSLARYRKEFEGARNTYNSTNQQLQDLQQVSDGAYSRMQQAKKDLTHTYDSLQTMDMTGASGARDRSGVRTYYVGGKEYHVDRSDADDVKMTPWREYRAQQKAKQEEECADADDMSNAEDPYDWEETGFNADDLADAIDVYASLCRGG